MVVVGAQPLIDTILWQRGMQPAYVGGYRVTNEAALQAAVQAAGHGRVMCEQYLSKVGPSARKLRKAVPVFYFL